MPVGKLKAFIQPDQQKFFANINLVLQEKDVAYGIIEDDTGREIFFSQDAVENAVAFNELHEGQRLEFTLENAPYLRAASVRLIHDADQPTI